MVYHHYSSFWLNCLNLFLQSIRAVGSRGTKGAAASSGSQQMTCTCCKVLNSGCRVQSICNVLILSVQNYFLVFVTTQGTTISQTMHSHSALFCRKKTHIHVQFRVTSKPSRLWTTQRKTRQAEGEHANVSSQEGSSSQGTVLTDDMSVVTCIPDHSVVITLVVDGCSNILFSHS